MTNETMLKELYTTLSLMKDDSGNNIDVNGIIKIARDSEGKSANKQFADYPEFHIADLIVKLESDILNETAKKNGTAARLKACKKILANAKKLGKESYYKPYIKGEYQYMTDGIALICLKDKIDMENGSEFDSINNIDISKMPPSNTVTDIIIPDKKLLEIEYKKKKALKIKPIEFQIQGKIFNAEKLINLMKCVEPDKIGVSEGALRNVGMLRVEDNNGNIGFLCGIRNNDISDDSIIKIENGKIVEK